MKNIRPCVVAIVAFALSACASHSSSAPGGEAHVGQPVPEWTKRGTSGSAVSISSLRGKAVYLDFFATWCPPCNTEAPDINALQKQYGPRGLQVVGVDELEGPSLAAKFVKKYSLVYPAVADEDGTIGSQYLVNGLPVHVFISRDGIVRKIAVGEMNKAQIEASIRALL